MYIFMPTNEKHNMNDNLLYDGVMDAINVASFIIGLQNLELNITANDIDNQTKAILDDLHSYLDKQEKHLTEQDNHLAIQDRHLTDQDMRLTRLEMYLSGKDIHARKESSK